MSCPVCTDKGIANFDDRELDLKLFHPVAIGAHKMEVLFSGKWLWRKWQRFERWLLVLELMKDALESKPSEKKRRG